MKRGVKKIYENFLQNSLEKTCARVSAKILRNFEGPFFLQNTCGRLLLKHLEYLHEFAKTLNFYILIILVRFLFGDLQFPS